MSSVRNLLALLAVAALAGCGGGGGYGSSESSGGTGGTGVSIGVMTVGSVVVNGVRYDDSAASITIDDSAATAAQLRDGMVVKVRGRRNADGVTGTAERVEVENEVRGTVQSTNAAALPPSFVVVGQTVLVDDLTVFDNFTPVPNSPSEAVGALTVASIVEVHGQRDVAGNIRASRIELLNANPLLDELRGRVTGLDTGARTFNLSGVPVSYTPTIVITPAGASLAENALVEIHGNFNGTTFVATRIDLEDLEDAQFDPAENEDFEAEGFIVGFTAHPGTFTINGRTVQTTVSTRFENGSAADLANNVKVEAEGRLSGSTLVADKISFRRSRVILTGVATVTGSIPGGGTLEVFGRSVQITSVTELRHSGGITNGERVEVRGFLDSGGQIVAERVEDNPGGGSADILQARVTAKNGNLLTLLGISADLTGATRFEDANDQLITRAAFLAAVTPRTETSPGTLVKVKGTFSPPAAFSATEAELGN